MEKALEKSEHAAVSIKQLNTKIAVLEQRLETVDRQTQSHQDIDLLFDKVKILEELSANQSEEATLTRLALDTIQAKLKDSDSRMQLVERQ